MKSNESRLRDRSRIDPESKSATSDQTMACTGSLQSRDETTAIEGGAKASCPHRMKR